LSSELRQQCKNSLALNELGIGSSALSKLNGYDGEDISKMPTDTYITSLIGVGVSNSYISDGDGVVSKISQDFEFLIPNFQQNYLNRASQEINIRKRPNCGTDASAFGVTFIGRWAQLVDCGISAASAHLRYNAYAHGLRRRVMHVLQEF